MKLFQSFNFLILLISIVYVTSSCSSKPEAGPDIIDPMPAETKAFTYLALGDSYTIGEGVEEAESWPFQLKAAMEANEYEVKEINVIAQTGWTTTNLLNAIDNQNPDKADIVSLLIGVNDQFQGRPFETFKEQFDICLSKSIELAGGADKVFLVSIPDYGVTPFGQNNSDKIAQELDTYNAYMKAECEARAIPFVDITQISRDLGNGPNALAQDQLHPSGFQYGKWTEAIIPVLKELLE